MTKPMFAWAISVLDDDDKTRMFTCPENVPELFVTRRECCDEIKRWVDECRAQEWKPKAVRVKVAPAGKVPR